MLKGIGASPGIVIGKILLVEKEDVIVEKQSVSDTESEVNHLKTVFEKCVEELEGIKQKTMKEVGEKEASIFDAHILVLKDPELYNGTADMIKNQNVNAAFAFKSISEQFITIFESMNNEYMRERASDIKDIQARVLRHLTGAKFTDLSNLDETVILVTDDLAPSDTATMDKSKVLGFLTDIGGKTSHSAIMARILEIPAIVGMTNITSQATTGTQVIVNGSTGEVILNPTQEEVEHYSSLRDAYLKEKEALKGYIGKKTITTTGKEIELFANIGSPEDLEAVLKNDAEGIGLYRSEFLYMNRHDLPSEEEQFTAYKVVAEGMKGKTVIIRTLDIGGDKEVDYLNIPKEMNPFLGYRAIRMCLCNIFTNREDSLSTCDNCDICKTNIFKTQLRALLRASTFGDIKIMFPMISCLEELLVAKEYLELVKRELDSEGIDYNKDIEIGIMIEIPAAALASDLLAKHVDFFSIGTNDLIQYTCAVDRMNPKIQHLYQPDNIGVQRLIEMTIKNAHDNGIICGMCGGMAEDQTLIPALLSYGLDEFSVSPSSILPTRKLINEVELNS